ncbi:hypothetical protein VN12_16370 [Pirellula sp. SH-Sr6A]|uniref:J domain-containing protein n=1 Tax=Pirellula sp. SH-Sr6A TaxID=1632865 RepID=UPI00078DF16D|nr:J domain-containing protein [Pirellula sp. SH-Sr6A]AMV33705.1 hypothetical protein VN12_16370 [Pirellula sp. SH-Sr6A]
MAADDVHWDRLPNDPTGFFDLPNGFDRKDLKRSYGRLIRIYKPETHPAEFQRIREAYESLETELRYGVTRELEREKSSAWEIEKQPSTGDQTHPTHATNQLDVPPPPVAPNVEVEPEAYYKHLIRSQTKSPRDYFELAILSDLLDREDPQRFLKWLLTGLKQYPTDPGLLRLVREHLTTDVDTDSAFSILVTLSKIVPPNAFFPTSEPLWERIYREVPFAKVSRWLEACESNFQQRLTIHHLIFYIHSLKRLAWTANWDWIQEKWQWIQSHGSEIPNGFDQDLEFLELLLDYIQIDREKIGENSIRQWIDDMLRAYCMDPWIVAAGKIAEAQDEIARSNQRFMETFPALNSKDDYRVLLLTQMAAWDAMDQLNLSLSDQTSPSLMRQADLAVAELRKEYELLERSLTRMENQKVVLPFYGVMLVPLLLAWGIGGNGTFAMLSIFWILGISLCYITFFKRRVVKPWVEKKAREMCFDAYEKMFRPRLFMYIQGSRVTPSAAAECLKESAHQTGSGNVIDVIFTYAAGDMGLRGYHVAQCFLH